MGGGAHSSLRVSALERVIGRHSRQGGPNPYGLSWDLLETPYGVGIGHRGGSFGVQAEVRRFTDRDLTLVLLSNGGDAGVPARLFGRLWEEVMVMVLGAP